MTKNSPGPPKKSYAHKPLTDYGNSKPQETNDHHDDESENQYQTKVDGTKMTGG